MYVRKRCSLTFCNRIKALLLFADLKPGRLYFVTQLGDFQFKTLNVKCARGDLLALNVVYHRFSRRNITLYYGQFLQKFGFFSLIAIQNASVYGKSGLYFFKRGFARRCLGNKRLEFLGNYGSRLGVRTFSFWGIISLRVSRDSFNSLNICFPLLIALVSFSSISQTSWAEAT